MTAFEKLKGEYLSEPEVAAILGIEVATLRNRRYEGKNHPPLIKVGESVLYRAEAFQKWLRDKEQRAIA